ncbi:hypothetical protein B0H16DRAFT_1724809 [Mycena metata]|uniref:Uncharacterized protein n=1 Tax=Mycena metata TaxID=1033252 RepID=A0AAD7N8C0_9AGAR|nr:hypothetical protein B0H16DRAFT_1724809 [Mycena metata]
MDPKDLDLSPDPLNDKIRIILEELGPGSLTIDQVATLNQMRGALTTGRDRLFAATAIVIDNQQETLLSHEVLLVAGNVKALRDLGMSEVLLGQILLSAAKARTQNLSRPTLPTVQVTTPAPVTSDIGAAANAMLTPCRQGESLEEYGRRAESTLLRTERTATAFVPPPGLEERIHNDRPTENRPATHFEDVGSISSALHRKSSFKTQSPGNTISQGNSVSHTGYLMAADGSAEQVNVFEAFSQETDEHIIDIVERALGEVLNLPSRIRAPKLDTPSKFTGTDNHLAYMRWIETLVGWMRTMLYGGSDPDTDSFRVSVLKNLLHGVTLQWYIDFVELAALPVDFTGVLCGLHHRFITTATAHHTLRDFDLIKYNPHVISVHADFFFPDNRFRLHSKPLPIVLPSPLRTLHQPPARLSPTPNDHGPTHPTYLGTRVFTR